MTFFFVLFFYQFRSYFCFRNIFLPSSLSSLFFHFIVSLYLSFFPCFYLSPSVDSLWPFLFFFFVLFFYSSLLTSSFGSVIDYIDRLKKKNRGDFSKNVVTSWWESVRTFFKPIIYPSSKRRERDLSMYSKNIDSSIYLFIKIQVFLFFFFKFSWLWRIVSFPLVFIFFSRLLHRSTTREKSRQMQQFQRNAVKIC